MKKFFYYIRFILAPVAMFLALSLVVISCQGAEEQLSQPKIIFKTNPVTYSAGSQYISIVAEGSWTLSITYKDGSSAWASLSASSGNDSRGDVMLSYTENDSDQSRTAIIIASNKLYSEEFVFVQNGQEKQTSTAKGSPIATATWLELPETQANDGYDFFYHTMAYNGSTVRNYSFYWDYDNLIARWVAYVQTKSYAYKTTSRTDAWALDPLLPRDKQPVLIRGFSGSNNSNLVDREYYSRGHQIPSADRLFSYEANSSTFYGTNMTPQLYYNSGSGYNVYPGGGFNGGIWASLETAVRDWGNSSDSLYVITGAVADGSTLYAYDNDGKKITVPVAYFKAVLRYSTAGTVGYNGYAACAFYLEHKEYSTTDLTSSYCMSVAELEEKLGYELFVNLPKAKGVDSQTIGKETATKIKSQNPATVKWWWNNM